MPTSIFTVSSSTACSTPPPRAGSSSGRSPGTGHRADPTAAEPAHRRAARYAWARLLARIYEVFPLVCPLCGAEMRIIAFLTDPVAVRAILAHLGEPTAPPRIAPARGPPLGDLPDSGTGEFTPHAQPAPEYVFDQRIAW